MTLNEPNNHRREYNGMQRKTHLKPHDFVNATIVVKIDSCNRHRNLFSSLTYFDNSVLALALLGDSNF